MAKLPNGKPGRESLYGRAWPELAAEMHGMQNRLRKGIPAGHAEMTVDERLDHYMAEYGSDL